MSVSFVVLQETAEVLEFTAIQKKKISNNDYSPVGEGLGDTSNKYVWITTAGTLK